MGIESLDVSDDVNALVEGEEISEEFKSKLLQQSLRVQ